jgi:hypothetical protein
MGKVNRKTCLGLLEKLKPMIGEEEYQLAVTEVKGGD